MSGISVIRYLLANNAPVLAVVTATNIKVGDLPVGTVLPAIGIKQIDSVPFNMLRINETLKVHTDRVQVTAILKDLTASGTGWSGLSALLKLVLAACPSQRGTVNSISVDSITPDIEGPDLPIPEIQAVSRSRDFLVRWVGA